jgi:hypothetical protein
MLTQTKETWHRGWMEVGVFKEHPTNYLMEIQVINFVPCLFQNHFMLNKM